MRILHQYGKRYVDIEELDDYIDSELKDLHTRLSDEELPELCQANCSGAIIWLDALRKELKGRGE